MDNNLNRLATFQQWPQNSSVYSSQLASEGFFYTGIADEVQCHICNVKIRDWKATDSISDRHRIASNRCPLVSRSINGRTSSESYEILRTNPNPPAPRIVNRTNSLDMDDDTIDGHMETHLPVDSRISSPLGSQTNGRQVVIRTHNDVLQVMSHPDSQNENWLETRDIHSTTHSRTIDFTIEVNRLSSFNGQWPETSPVTATELASAGLYFTGPGDRVQCAFCRGGLLNWESGDTAIGEHVRHFPNCQFAQDKMKGLLGVQTNVTTQPVAKQPTLDREEWIDAPAVNIAKKMGYHLDLIKKAAEKVLTHSCKRLSCNSLMDAIFDLESSSSDLSDASPTEPEVPSSLYEGATGGRNPIHFEPLSDTPKRRPSENHDRKVDKNLAKSENLDKKVDKNHAKSPTSNCGNEMQALLAENQRLRGNTTCKICLDAEVDTLFLPCRHLVCCDACANAVKTCPLCRTLILGTVKAFLS